jgi:predicted  nucleic acid-binding Zn-ribbon protein
MPVRSWFVNDYAPEQKTDPEEQSLNQRVQVLEESINKLNDRLETIHKKLDRLIESNKSLIAYFSSVSDRDIRDLNFKIRGYSSKHMAPIGFVPEKSKSEL